MSASGIYCFVLNLFFVQYENLHTNPRPSPIPLKLLFCVPHFIQITNVYLQHC